MFVIYDFVSPIKNTSKAQFITDQYFFIREINEDGTYVCDEFQGENHIRKHVIVQLPVEMYEKKNVRAFYTILESYPETNTYVLNPTAFPSIESIRTDAPRYAIWGVSIVCGIDCKALGIDPAAPWPPKAA